MRARRSVNAAIALLVLAGVGTGVITGGFSRASRAGLYATGLWTDGGAATLPPGTFDSPSATARPEPTPQGQPAGVLRPVFASASEIAPENPTQVARRVRAVDSSAVKGSVSGVVLDARTGAQLYAENASRGFIPASTAKLLSTTAALSILGPEHRFATRVVSSGAGQIILVGGGDPYLTGRAGQRRDPERASLVNLARATARKLKDSHRNRVTLGYDVSLFQGPAWNTDWPTLYRDQVTPVSPLTLDEGRVNGGSPGPRVANAPKAAADAFADELKRQGVRVDAVTEIRAGKGAKQLASVSSMPLEGIVQRLLMVSDNDAAEILFRQVAIGAGRPGSSDAARSVVSHTLAKLGLADAMTVIRDGSGLSRRTRVRSLVLARTLRLGMAAQHPELRAVVTGLPVAGVEGSLRIRFTDKQSAAGRGIVRGKTGTLSKVTALAGFLRTADGSLLVYAFLVNKPKNELGARAWLDRVTSALSGCGCR